MACARNIGLTDLPIVCVNVDGYYDPFREMLDRGYREKMIVTHPDRLIRFVRTAVEAVQWIEQEVASQQQQQKKKKAPPHDDDDDDAKHRRRRRASTLKRSSIVSDPVHPTPVGSAVVIRHKNNNKNNTKMASKANNIMIALTAFSAGVAVAGMFLLRGRR